MKESDLPGVIQKRLDVLDRKAAWLAAESGVSRSHLYGFLAGHVGTGKKKRESVRLRWEAIEKLFDVLGLSVSIEVSEKTTPARRRKVPTPPDMPV